MDEGKRLRIVTGLLAAQVALLVLVLLVLISALLLGFGMRRRGPGEASERIMDSLDDLLAETVRAQQETGRLVEQSSANVERLETIIGRYDSLLRRQAELLSMSLRPQIEIALFVDEEGGERIVLSNPGKPLSSLSAKGYGYLALTLAGESPTGLAAVDVPYYGYYRLPEYDSLLSGEMARIESWEPTTGARLTPGEAAEALRRSKPPRTDVVLVAVRFERYVFLEYTDEAQRERSELYFIDRHRVYRVDPVRTKELTESYVRYRRYEDVFAHDERRDQRLEELWIELVERVRGRPTDAREP